MIEIIRIRIQTLNGENIVKQIRLPANRIFQSHADMEKYRKLKEMKLQWKADQRGYEEKISVLFDLKEP